MGEQFILGNAQKNVLGCKLKDNNYDLDKLDLNNNNDSHSIIINYIKKGTVLDVGCSTGIIGKHLVQKKIIVDGIEYDSVAFELLKKSHFYRNIYNLSVSDFHNKETKEFYCLDNKYDYIVFADVLEHLVNPDEVIYEISKKLNKNGSILVSIPNIAHIDVIKALINGEFNYNDKGILDSTHLRFFTEHSFYEMIDNVCDRYNINFSVQKIGDTRYMPNYGNDIEASLFKSVKNIDDYSIVQNIFEIKVCSKDKKIKHKHNNSFKTIIDNYSNALNENKILKDKIKDQQNVIEDLETNINSIVNSKRYKIIDKIFKIFKR